MQLPAAIETSLALRRLARRAGLRSRRATARRPALARPVGLKVELTHRCNLRCGFCYTDSPRRTLEGTLDMSDSQWRAVIDEAIEVGIIEAVVSGGEPLLRKDLALEVIERLGKAGVAVSLNTNGWFVDESVADRLAAVRGLRVHVSVDGATPQVHDAARGVPGSWRRAVGGVDLLLARGVAVEVLHVVTPPNVSTLPDFLEQMWVLGVRTTGVSTAVPIGAAAREPGWVVGRRPVYRAVKSFRRRHGEDMSFILQPPALEGLATREDRPPASLLVRPNGAVMLDSVHPFSFGGVDEGLAVCWERALENWRDPRITEWVNAQGNTDEMPGPRLVAYRDEPVAVSGRSQPAVAGRRAKGGRLPPPPAKVTPTDLDAAREEVTQLALHRRYRGAEVRWSGNPQGERYVRALDGRTTFRVNGTVALVMEACDGGTPHEALDRLRRRHPSVSRERLARDTVQAVRWLSLKGLLHPAGAPA